MAQIQDEKLKKVVEVLKEEFRPCRLFLFGSRASRNSPPGSDYDFVLVVDQTTRNKWENFDVARDLVRKQCGVSADQEVAQSTIEMAEMVYRETHKESS